MSNKNFIHDKEFTKLFEKPCKKAQLDGGKFTDNEIQVSFSIMKKEKGLLQFKVKFLKHPDIYPFRVIIGIEIRGQETHFFYERKDSNQKNQCLHSSQLKQDLFFEPNTTVTYTIRQISFYTRTLINPKCLCYFNSVIQLLFHLSKFRKLVTIKETSKLSMRYLNKMKELFNNLISNNSDQISPIPLTESFGWPLIACEVQHDAAEFFCCLIDRIKSSFSNDTIKRSVFDSLFTSHFSIEDEKYCKEEEQTVIIINSTEGSFIDAMQTYLNRNQKVRKFTKFPEIMFIEVNLPYGQFEEHVDLSLFSSSSAKCKYTLSGFIIRIGSSMSSGHYKSIFRSSEEGIWYYFNDSIQGFYTTLNENENIQTILNDVSTKTGQKERIRIAMYIRDDVLNESFRVDENVIPVKQKSAKNEKTVSSFCVRIITEQNIKDHVSKLCIDFVNVEYKVAIFLAPEETKKNLYEKVAKELNVRRDSFVLRYVEESGAPSCCIYSDDDSELHLLNEISYFFFEEKKENEDVYKSEFSVPLFFLSFEFNARKFVLNLECNLMNMYKSKSIEGSNKVRSAPPRMRQLKLDQNDDDDYEDEEEEKISLKKMKEYEKLLDRNEFKYLTVLTLNSNSCLDSYKPLILKSLGKKDDVKLVFFIAKSDKITNTQIVEIDSSKPIKDCFCVLSCKYIFVQCQEDEELDENCCNELSNVVDMKFVFFKYMQKAFSESFYVKSFSNVFMIQNFSIPVTFVKLSDVCKRSKTFLFPLFCLSKIEHVHKLICAAMDEVYDEKNMMQLFLSFKKDSPPFNDKVTNIRNLNRALVYSLFNTPIRMYKIHCMTSNCESFSYEDENDTDFEANVYIYYSIFGSETSNKISLRTYYSSDSYSIDCMSQVLLPFNTKVSDLVSKIDEIFHIEKLPEEDRRLLHMIKNCEKKFEDSFIILKISNSKVSGIVGMDYSPSSNLAIRFDLLHPRKDFIGFVPVFYGAKFNNTKLVSAFGSPFLLPVTKSDIEETKPAKYKMSRFVKSEVYRRLTKKVEKLSEIELYVTNYDGLIQSDISVWNFEKLVQANNEFKFYIAICFNKINAASFMDEENFFKGSIKILN